MTEKNALLSLNHISLSFGGVKAVQNFEFEIYSGEICGLIGPNGAGKTTIFNVMTGVYTADTGTVTLNQKNVTQSKPHQISRQGLARTFQNIRLFKELTVLENLMTAFHQKIQYGLVSSVLRSAPFMEEEENYRKKSLELLSFFDLEKCSDHEARCLSYGDQRKLEILRALATDPKVILLDEPGAGLNPTEKEELREKIRVIRDQFQVAVLLIEHDMRFVMGLCDRIAVLNYGKKIAEGTPDQIKCDPKVIEAYLGEATC